MGSYIPSSEAERREMLEALGMESVRELYKDVPESVLLDRPLNLPEGLSEMEVRAKLEDMAKLNRNYRTILRGAGAYDHYIPSIVRYIPAKEEFLTAYTPYQAEMSQGVLQSIFEYQTMICELTGMDVSNASVYDGASAAAEAAAMCRDRKRSVTLISETVHPDVINTVRTYCYGANAELKVVPAKDGKTDLAALKEMLAADTAGVIFQQPNFFGLFEDAEEIIAAVHEAGAMAVMSCNPIALAVMKTPGELGADVAVGEGQPLGLPLGFGGPFLGFMAYVLSLQAREQHIRREKASSNICSNEALCALTAGLYMATMGPDGMAEVARQCMAKAHYLAQKLIEAGCRLEYSGRFFHEFVTRQENCREILGALSDEGILGGLLLPDGESILWCVTEKASKEALDEVADIVKEALA